MNKTSLIPLSRVQKILPFNSPLETKQLKQLIVPCQIILWSYGVFLKHLNVNVVKTDRFVKIFTY